MFFHSTSKAIEALAAAAVADAKAVAAQADATTAIAAAAAAAADAASAAALAATKHKFVGRGDPASFDKLIGDFTVDGNWHDWDLSGIIDAGAKVVLIHFRRMKATSTAGVFHIRNTDKSNTKNICFMAEFTSNLYYDALCFVVPDANGKIEYNIHTHCNYCEVVVAGWFV